MPITILNPRPAAQQSFDPAVARKVSDSDSESDDGGVDIHGDVSMADQEHEGDDDETTEVLTPGTIITSDPKWMRYLSTSLPLSFPFIFSLRIFSSSL